MRPRLVEMLAHWVGPSFAALVPGYVFMLALGAVLGSVIAVDSAKREGFSRTDSIGTLMVAYASGLVGACAVPAGQAVLAWLEGGKLAAPTGFAAYGGLVGGTLGGLAWLRFRLRASREGAWTFLDVVAPSLALGIFFARIGCFLAGCDYGMPTRSIVGTTFPPLSHAFRDHVARGWIDASAPASLPVHPTELYEAAAGLALFFFVRAIHSPRRGARFVALVVGYALARSTIELVRGDASRGHVSSLSTAQIFAVVTSAVVLACFARAQRTKASPA
jgi:phosphatidylglycerol:prolipoprotein diacylglycerol transferase